MKRMLAICMSTALFLTACSQRPVLKIAEQGSFAIGGKVLTDSEQVGQWGAPTLDVWVVRKDFAEKHPEVVKAFAKSAIDAQQPYIANPDAWLKQPENISKLARLSGVPEGDVPGLVKGNTYLTPQQQTAELTGPVNKAIIDTAQFLKEQGKVPAVANDYSQYVTSRFVQ
mgnify:CR=1 FL=1